MSPVPFENPPADAEVPAAASGTAQNATDATLSEAWVTIRARKKFILGVAALGLIYGFYQGATQPGSMTLPEPLRFEADHPMSIGWELQNEEKKDLAFRQKLQF